MTDLFAGGARRFDESLPPSLLGGGGPLPAGDRTADVIVATGVDTATIADLAALKAHLTIGDQTAWGEPSGFPAGGYVVLGDSSTAWWDGDTWFAGVAPPAPPPPPPVQLVLDPATLTVAEVIAWVEDNYGDHEGTTPQQRAELQAVLDAERAGLNRSTLVEYLDHLEGLH